MITYRAAGPWGAGKGSNLVASDYDNTIWSLVQLINAKAGQGVGIASITIAPGTNNELLFQMTDHSYLPPITIPIAELPFKGNWLIDTPYQVGDLITVYNGTVAASIYQVLFAHTSAGTFDPGANDGLGHNYYLLVLTIPSWLAPAVQTQTGRTWTPGLADATTYNRFTNSLSIIVMVPSNEDVAFPIGTEITMRQAGGGLITIDGDSGVIVNPQDSCFNTTSGEGATVKIKKVALNEWDISGRLEVHAF